MVETNLQTLFQAIARAQDERELKQPVMAKLGEYFGASRWNLFDRLPAIDENSPILMKLALSLDYNPVLRYVVQRHSAVHEAAILPPGIWQKICPRMDHGHVMLGPIAIDGQLAGGVAFTRHRNLVAFNAENIADLNALCLHFSTKIVKLRSQSVACGVNCDRLTPREFQIAELVARGLTNAEIGKVLWITENSVKQALKRMFRKLKVTSRAQMVAQLSPHIKSDCSQRSIV